jgi:hypothetical protein
MMPIKSSASVFFIWFSSTADVPACRREGGSNIHTHGSRSVATKICHAGAPGVQFVWQARRVGID